jgi:hypothetical protein
MDLMEVSKEDVNWIKLAQERIQLLASVNITIDI